MRVPIYDERTVNFDANCIDVDSYWVSIYFNITVFRMDIWLGKIETMTKKKIKSCSHTQWIEYLSGGWQWCSQCGSIHHPGPGAKWERPSRKIKV